MKRGRFPFRHCEDPERSEGDEAISMQGELMTDEGILSIIQMIIDKTGGKKWTKCKR